MWKEIIQLFKRDSLCDEAFNEAIEMLEASKSMYADAVSSLRNHGLMEANIYDRDKRLNKYERSVRRKIVSHLAVSENPDVNTALVLTAIVIDIERIGDYTKNIVELAAEYERAFRADAIEDEIASVEKIISGMFDEIIPALREEDVDQARQVYADHESVTETVDETMRRLIRAEEPITDCGSAVTAALYLRYLKRISAHLKNVATSVVNPYYRIGFREKQPE